MSAKQPGFKQIIKAVFGAMIGVQSEQQRQQDFSASSPLPYILVGVMFAIIFVVVLILIVSWVLA
ncbi:DUF2970 domain-containing protein [Rheinheimera baltica]|uniref:DUF2970 domain-containing protein n=1 Tax=Rheinheimera baltica TaxID=67576 RepID=UPI0003FB65AE|nr:DUF2970 domain-containing protein [Rheinheimera baltica]MDP5144307.1 DUF2970 domain-containing protein [Rheinheimera baltica]MDP5151475.1 DUF2970 domain-containing protein [Rheinheimera baltica]MDP5191081.1 DUF2970 domain-containing protein [Rheinheimera baltica]